MKKLKTKKTNQAGFTLIELILYVALITLLISALVQFAWNLVYGKVKAQVQVDVHYTTRFVSQRITKLIREASGVNSASGSTLSLSYSDSALDPTVISVQSGRVYLGRGLAGSCNSSSPCPLTSSKLNIPALNFTNLSSGNSFNIMFDLTLESTSDRKEWQHSSNYSSSVELQDV